MPIASDSSSCESLPPEKETTSNEVCASAEANVFVQTVALFISCYSPRQPEDVTCPSGYCFGRQHSLSQPNIGQTYNSRCYAFRFTYASMGFQTNRERTPIQMQTRNMMYRCRAVVSISDCSATAHRRDVFFPASATALKSDCPQHSRYLGHPKDNLFGV